MKCSKSNAFRVAAIGLPAILFCGSALADPAIVQVVATAASFVFPQYAIGILLVSPAVQGSAARRKKGKPE